MISTSSPSGASLVKLPVQSVEHDPARPIPVDTAPEMVVFAPDMQNQAH